jgi:hypothetical protein
MRPKRQDRRNAVTLISIALQRLREVDTLKRFQKRIVNRPKKR